MLPLGEGGVMSQPGLLQTVGKVGWSTGTRNQGATDAGEACAKLSMVQGVRGAVWPAES